MDTPLKWVWCATPQMITPLTNKKRCPYCLEYHQISRISTFLMIQGIGIFEPYKCNKCNKDFLLPTDGRVIDHINNRGRDPPITEKHYQEIKADVERKFDNPSDRNIKE